MPWRRGGRGFLNRPTRPIIRKTTAPLAVSNSLGSVGVSASVATSTSVVVVVSLGSVTTSTAVSTTITLTGLVDNNLGVVAMTVGPVLALGLDGPVSLGAVTLTVGPVTTVAMGMGSVALGAVTMSTVAALALTLPQPGTLANPYAATDSDTRTLDFATALFVTTEPVPLTGSPAAPSVWYRFAESQTADLLASTSGFTNGATIELYTGEAGALIAADVTFIATDGVLAADLGAVSVGAVAGFATGLQANTVDVGAVVVDAVALLDVVLT